LAQTTTDTSLIADQVVDAILGANPESGLEERVSHVSRAYDESTAESYGRVLVDRLAGEPASPPELEALVVLGLAHPRVLGELRIPLVREGRRLAALLEGQGRADRAQALLEMLSRSVPADRKVDQDLTSMLRRTGNLDRLVERNLARAEEAMADGRRRDAITWLREVLMLDRSRRDVARMIRDLQYDERVIKEGWSRRLRLAAGLLMLVGLCAGVTFRELHVRRLYQALPEVRADDLDSLGTRLAAIDALLAGNPLWLGMFEASRERAQLRTRIDQIEARRAAADRQAADREAEARMMADSARTRAVLLLDQRDFPAAAAELRRALEFAPPDWQHRGRVEADLAAILAWQAEQAGAPGR
jgi:tetratricopeptide (TPR) repeat protein